MSIYLVNNFEDAPFRQAKWIAPQNCEAIQNLYFRARTEFELYEISGKAILHIAAESYYLLYVNGIEAGRGPARGTGTLNFYDSYDITSLLHNGRNTIAVLVLCMNYKTFTASPVHPGLIAEINGMIASNHLWDVCIADDWRRDVQTYSWQAGYSEWRDLRLEPEGWTVGKDSAAWEPAWEIPKSNPVYAKDILPRKIPALAERSFYPADITLTASVEPTNDLDTNEIYKLMKKEKYRTPAPDQITDMTTLLNAENSSARINPTPDNSGATVIFDFAEELVGYFEIELTAPAGCVVDICHNETVPVDRLAVDHLLEPYHFIDRYILREGRQKIGNTLQDRGFRVVQIVCRNFKAPIKIHKVKAVDCRYPFVQRGSFNSDDQILNRIWDTCRETLETCTTDIFTDCPWRERAFWVNDLVVENKTSLQAFGNSEVHRRAFTMAFSEKKDEGVITGVCPCPDVRVNLVLIPTNLFIVFMLKDYLLYSNDREFVRKFIPELSSILKIFKSWENEQGLLLPPEKYWNFFDWSFEINDISLTGKQTSLLNYVYISAMKTFIEIAELIGEEIDREMYNSRIARTSGNIEKHFFKEDQKLLADWLENGTASEHSSQLAHAFALLSNECSQTNKTHIENALNNPDILMPELYLHYFILKAMRLCGKEQTALDRIRKYWGDIVKTGATTIWEIGIHGHGKEAFSGDASLCHGFATSPIDFFQTTLLGIEPLTPGFETFTVNPVPLDLNFAEGRVPTPNGNIYIKWEREGDHLNIELKVPEKTIAQAADGNSYETGSHNIKLYIKEN